MIGDSCSSKFVMMWWVIAFVVIVVMIEKVVLAVGAVVVGAEKWVVTPGMVLVWVVKVAPARSAVGVDLREPNEVCVVLSELLLVSCAGTKDVDV